MSDRRPPYISFATAVFVGAETRRFIGHLDVPLSPLGERQISAIAEHRSDTALEASRGRFTLSRLNYQVAPTGLSG